MRLAFQWRPGLPRNGLPHCRLARWLTIAFAGGGNSLVCASLLRASRNDFTIGKQSSEQDVAPHYGQASDVSFVVGSQLPCPLRRLSPTGNESSPLSFPLTANRLASYEAPRPTAARCAARVALGPCRAGTPAVRAVPGIAARSGSARVGRSRRRVPAAPPGPAPSGLALPPRPAGGGAQLKLIDISLDGLFAAGTSTERDPALQELEGGGHDPRKRGFTVRGVELSMMGAVDPYLDGEMHLVNFIDPIQGDTVVELEEAFMTTRSLPHGLQLKAGQFLTEFGRINPTHPHAWAWLDQPIINTRVFGPDGMRAPGARLSWLVPVDWFSQVYVDDAERQRRAMSSFLANEAFFEERPIGGRPFVYRDVRSLGDLTYTVALGELLDHLLRGGDLAVRPVGGLRPEHAPAPSGNTQIYGLDLTRKWKPAKNERGWPFTIWMSEFIVRRYWADSLLRPQPGRPGDAPVAARRDAHRLGLLHAVPVRLQAEVGRAACATSTSGAATTA